MYPGGLKEIKYKTMMERKPDEASFVNFVHGAIGLTRV
jgi:hypothetical protein